MIEGTTCYERDEVLCEDQMCLRVGCRLRNARLAHGHEPRHIPEVGPCGFDLSDDDGVVGVSRSRRTTIILAFPRESSQQEADRLLRAWRDQADLGIRPEDRKLPDDEYSRDLEIIRQAMERS